MLRTVLTTFILLMALLGTGCSRPDRSATLNYPRKPSSSEERKAGRAMFFYEQAEKDMDIYDSVIVTPPEQRQEKPATATE